MFGVEQDTDRMKVDAQEIYSIAFYKRSSSITTIISQSTNRCLRLPTSASLFSKPFPLLSSLSQFPPTVQAIFARTPPSNHKAHIFLPRSRKR